MKKRILIVDDELDILALVKMILEDAGYECGTATNGLEALSVIGSQSYDLVLLDIMMPLLNGWEVLRELRGNANTVSLPVALLTARAAPGDDAVPSTDYSDYITKPFDPEDLLKRIQKILG